MLILLLAIASLLATEVTAQTKAIPPHYDDWQNFGVADGLPSDKTFCVLAGEREVWVGTDSGLAMYRNGRWKTFTSGDGLAHDAVLALAEDSQTGDLWVATMGGVSRFSAGRFESFTQFNSGLANNVVYSVAVHRGEVWAATAAGTSRLELARNMWSIYDETNTSMHEIWCYSVSGAKDRIYVGVWGAGLLEYDMTRSRWKRYHDPDGEMEIDLFRDDGLIHDVVSSVAVDEKDRVWIATYFGLSSYDGRRWRNFMDHDSPLLSNFINFVSAQGEFCWIATDKGLNATDRESWWSYRIDPETNAGLVGWHESGGEETSLSLDTIFPHNYVLGVSLSGDDIWVATEKGIGWGRSSVKRADSDASPLEVGTR